MSNAFLLVGLLTLGLAAHAEDASIARAVEKVTATIEQLPCSNYLDQVDLPFVSLSDYPRTSLIPLRARETAARLLLGAQIEPAFQGEVNRQAQLNPNHPTFQTFRPSEASDLELKKLGMINAWHKVQRPAWDFAKDYPAMVHKEIAAHQSALVLLDQKARQMIEGISSEAETHRVSEAIAILYAQIMDEAHAVVDRMFNDPDRQYRINLDSPASAAARIRDVLSDYGASYDARIMSRVSTRLREPDVRKMLSQEVQFVRRKRQIERDALRSNNRGNLAERARDLIAYRLRNNWALLVAKPEFSGTQIMQFRASLKKLRRDVQVFAPAGSLQEFNDIKLEMVLKDVIHNPLLAQILLRTDVDLPESIAPPVAPVKPTLPQTVTHKTTGNLIMNRINERAATKANTEAYAEHQLKMAKYREETRNFQTKVIEHQIAESQLQDRYEARARARRIFLMYLAYVHPFETFRTVPNLASDPTLKGPGSMDSDFVLGSMPGALTLRAEARATIRKAFERASTVTARHILKGLLKPNSGLPEEEMLEWMLYAHVLLPDLQPGIPAAPARVYLEVKDQRPRMTAIESLDGFDR